MYKISCTATPQSPPHACKPGVCGALVGGHIVSLLAQNKTHKWEAFTTGPLLEGVVGPTSVCDVSSLVAIVVIFVIVLWQVVLCGHH